jgi:hypothetical protein
MRARLISLSAVILFSCAPALIQFHEDEHLVEIYDELNATQDELYLKANSWMIESFKDAESVIQHSDKDEGAIIGKYLMAGGVSTSMYGSVDTRIYAIIDIRVKDNRAKIEIKPQESWHYDASGMTVYNFSKEDAQREMVRLAQSFFDSIHKETVEF